MSTIWIFDFKIISKIEARHAFLKLNLIQTFDNHKLDYQIKKAMKNDKINKSMFETIIRQKMFLKTFSLSCKKNGAILAQNICTINESNMIIKARFLPQ